MRLLTAMEIYGNYPDNILIDAQKDPDSDKWTSLMYMTRNGGIHKLMLSFDGFQFDSKQIAIDKMNEVAKCAIDYMTETRQPEENRN